MRRTTDQRAIGPVAPASSGRHVPINWKKTAASSAPAVADPMALQRRDLHPMPIAKAAPPTAPIAAQMPACITSGNHTSFVTVRNCRWQDGMEDGNDGQRRQGADE